MKTNRFSIITITKNNNTGFKKTQLSIESQSYSDFEWIVIDGDKEPDNGIYDAMNKGLDRASGDYVIIMNAGDQFADCGVLKIVSPSQSDFIYGDYNECGYVIPAKNHRQIKYGMITSHQAMFYRRSVIDDLRFDEKYQLAADYKFTLQFLQKAATFQRLDVPICVFGQGGMSQRYAMRARREERAIRKELGIFCPLTPLRQWVALLSRSLSYRLYLRMRLITRRS